MSALIIVEHNNQLLHPSIRQVLTAARFLVDKPILLIIGENCQSVANQAAKLPGIGGVWLADNPCYAHQLADNVSRLIQDLADSFSYILSGSSTFSKNILPRVAALLDVAQVSEVTAILSKNTVEHVIYAGNVVETVKMLDAKKVMTIRSAAFDAVEGESPPCSIDFIKTIIENTKTSFVSHQLNKSMRPELTSAKIVVAGGRGLQRAENFRLIEALADELGAAIGASRAAVDAGFVSNDYQVGQTGKIVAPQLYIAIGISGAIQHLAGMKDSKVIVAINKDPEAPIFSVADYGLVADLNTAVPELTKALG